jgi:hypothetical protein
MRHLRLKLTEYDKKRATPGFTLFSPLSRPMTYLLNMEGEVVHEWTLPGIPGGYARLLPNGNLFYSAQTEVGPAFAGGAQGGLMREVDWDGNVISEYVDNFQHHDCRRLENGNIVYAGWELMPEKAAARVQGGVSGTDLPDGNYSDYVKEVNSDGKTVWEWHAWQHMEIEKYPLHPLCPRRVFAWCNSTHPLDNGDVMISLRQINLVAIIDRETKQFRWEKSDIEWGHQHDCKLLENGNIMMFANGMNTTHAHPHSRVIELDPMSGETVWEYRGSPWSTFYSHHISGVERLASGNTLICEGSFGRIFEVTPDGDIVWEYVSPYFDENWAGDTVNWVFRAFRYTKDSPEIAGRF